MAGFNDNNIGAISGAVRDMVSESTNRAMNGHGFPEAPPYTETDQIHSHSGPTKYILAAIGVIAALFLLLLLLSKRGDRQTNPSHVNTGDSISSEAYPSAARRFAERIQLTRTEADVFTSQKDPLHSGNLPET